MATPLLEPQHHARTQTQEHPSNSVRSVSASNSSATNASATPESAPKTHGQKWWFSKLERPSQAFAYITPNWFASIMGTGIVANAAVSLPFHVPGLHTAALVIWMVTFVLFLGLVGATITHWIGHRSTASSHLFHPVMAHFYGTMPMAFLTVGAGTLQLGRDLLGESLAVKIHAVLWVLGTLLGIFFTVAVPALQFMRHSFRLEDAFPGWLLTLVSLMVSSSTGAMLLPYVPAGEWRITLMYSCYAMFGISLLASFCVLPVLWAKLALRGVGPAAQVPTLWLVLGPLGQSVTAVNLLGTHAHITVDEPTARVLEMFGILYGVPVIGFAMLWLGIAAVITIRTIKLGMPFSLTWWGFTFPVGTVATGFSGLALHTDLTIFKVGAMAIYLLLVCLWAIVAVRSFRASFITGELLAVPTK